MKIILTFWLMLCLYAPAWAQATAYPKLAGGELSYGIVEIADFSVDRLPIYNSVDGLPVDYILFELKDYDNGRFYATRAQNGLKFYPYQLWQGEDVANAARWLCPVAENDSYLLQMEVVGDVSGDLLKIVTHFAFGCPQNIDGVPMYIPYGIRAGEGKVEDALDFDEYFLINFDPTYMRLKSWEEVMHSATGVSNYGGLEVYDKPDGVLIYPEGFADSMRIVSELTGDWVEVEGYEGRRGWIKWRENGALHPQIHEISSSCYDAFSDCVDGQM